MHTLKCTRCNSLLVYTTNYMRCPESIAGRCKSKLFRQVPRSVYRTALCARLPFAEYRAGKGWFIEEDGPYVRVCRGKLWIEHELNNSSRLAQCRANAFLGSCALFVEARDES